LIAFVQETLPGRTLFGRGRLADVQRETEKLGARALVLCSASRRGLAERVAELLGDACVGVHDRAVMHVPYERVVGALARVEALSADVLVAVGGGSTIGFAKAVALQKPLPILAIPTTYAGSEMTSIWGVTRDDHKSTGRDPAVKPRTVIYDPDLTLALPAAVSAASGMNAMAHAVEALYADGIDPVTALMAEEGVRALGAALPRVVANPTDPAARSEALYGAWLAGTVLGGVGMALHHKLSHVLGGNFGLPHAEVHSVLLPQVVAFNSEHAPVAMAAVVRALDADISAPFAAAEALYALQGALGTPRSLAELGLDRRDLAHAAELALQQPYDNPRTVTLEGVRGVLERAFHGVRPGTAVPVD
jgi:alcohol dehydrogenase class IV